MTPLQFIEEAVQNAINQGYGNSWHAQQLGQALIQVIQNPYAVAQPLPPIPAPPSKPAPPFLLGELTDSELVHEMMGRGYAVMRIKDPAKSTTLEQVQP